MQSFLLLLFLAFLDFGCTTNEPKQSEVVAPQKHTETIPPKKPTENAPARKPTESPPPKKPIEVPVPRRPKERTSASPPSTLEEATRRIPVYVTDRSGWAKDILASLEASKREPSRDNICAVIAIVEQESNFQVDPPVANLPRIVKDALTKKLKPLGKLAAPALKAILEANSPGKNVSFEQRIGQLNSERDLDRLFRDIQSTFSDEAPGPYDVMSAISRLWGKGNLSSLNPVTTAGAMQVKVDFAKGLPEMRGKSDAEVRESLYTRAGGLRAGVARLMEYDASYDDYLYRFADYNSGVYSSRNAAFQEMLADLTGEKLVLDGDIMLYDEKGDPSSVESKSLHAFLVVGRKKNHWTTTIVEAAKQEKTREFEDTAPWKDIRQAWEVKIGRKAFYARLPKTILNSPKMSRVRSTEWFARNVKRRFDACRARKT